MADSQATMKDYILSCLYFLKDKIDEITDSLDEKYIVIEGSRGKLKGYEDIEEVTSSSVAINSESPDTILALNATTITVGSGESTNCFVKMVHTSDNLMAITADNTFEWTGGVIPNFGKGLLVVAWGGTQGMLNFVSNVTVKNYTINFVDINSPVTILATVNGTSIINEEINYTISGAFTTTDGTFYPIFDGMVRTSGTYTVGMMGPSDTTFTIMCEKTGD